MLYDGDGMPKREDLIKWCISVPKSLDMAVKELLKAGTYMSRSDLVRDAVRRLLKEIRAEG